MIPSSKFEPGRTHCPGCHATLQKLVDECPFCGFTAAQCVSRFPFEPPPLARFIDPDGRLESKDRAMISKAVNRLEKKFPQVRLYFCIAKLGKGVDPREFGYWLFNRSRPENAEDAECHSHAVLMVIDRTSRRASLTIGYGLDAFVDDVMLTRALEVTGSSFRAGLYGEGLMKFSKGLRTLLVERQKQAAQVEAKWHRLRKTKPPAQDDREGARQPDVVVAHRESVELPEAKPARRRIVIKEESDDHATVY